MNKFICRMCGNDNWKYEKEQSSGPCHCTGCGVFFSSPQDFSLPPVKYKKLSDKAHTPLKATSGSVAFDLFATKSLDLWPGKPELVPTDLSIALPENTEMQIRGRSGFSKKGIMIANGVGTIDCFTGDMKILTLEGEKPFSELQEGDVVFSFDGEEVSKNPILKKIETGPKEILEIETKHGTLCVSKNTKVFTPNGIVLAKDIQPGDEILIF